MSSIAQALINKWQGNPTGLKEDYRSRLQHGVWVVEFTKADGTAAVMDCTLDPKLLPPLKEGYSAHEPRPEPEHLLHVFSTDRQGWRSFIVANVKTFYSKPESL